MDRQFGSPRDVADASPEALRSALRRALSALEQPTGFLYEAAFEFGNGRKAPVFMVGAMRGRWRDYLRRNASAAGFCAGTCHPRRDGDGRLVLELVAERGRARGGAHARTINLGPMRGFGEVRFVERAGAAPAAAATTAGAGAGAASEPAAAPESTPAPPAAADILRGFAEFKQAPTTAGLEALSAAVADWQAAGGGGPQAEHVQKIARLLAEKGRAYVASKGG